MTGCETVNKYELKNAMGLQMYFAIEENDCCNRHCCGPNRSFDIQIMDNEQNEVIHLNRPLACCLQVKYIIDLLIRVNSPNSGCLPNTGFWPFYTMLSHFAAFGRTKN